MAATAIDRAAPLPFANLDDVLLPLLLGTGLLGAMEIERLMGKRGTALGHHIGSVRFDTPAGRLGVHLNNQNGARQLTISLEMSGSMGCVHGEVYAQKTLVPEAAAIAAVGRPLSALCETPAEFPGRDRPIVRVRRVVSSTRILIQHEAATCSLADIHPTGEWARPARRRA